MAAEAVESLAFPEEKKKYIVEKLDPVLELMVQEVLLESPSSTRDFMISWLQKRAGGADKGEISMREKNDRLKRELASIKETLSGAAGALAQGRRNSNAESEESDDDDDDVVDDPEPPPAFSRKPRASVSAEAYGDWNKARSFTPPSYPKTTEQTGKLRQILSNSFMFSNLETKDLSAVLGAMQERTFAPGTRIITEGDDGDVLYVIEEGNPVCKKKIGGEIKVVKKCGAGDVFGELALLYNNPRAATVEAVDACKCWELDRETFSHIVKEAATKQSQMRDRFLQNVSLLSGMSSTERSQISDSLKVERFTKGQAVVSEGESGNSFYIVEEGNLAARKGNVTVMEYRAGDYFGELALLKNQPRAASVVVTSEEGAKVLSLDRKIFQKMIGPLQDILSRKSQEYK